EEFGLKTIDDLLSELGYGKLSAKKVLYKLSPKDKPENAKPAEAAPIQKIYEQASKQSLARQTVKVKGIEDLLVHFARCCGPVPGDSVVGFITRGRGISVHTK